MDSTVKKNRTRIEYIWLDGGESLPKLRSKTRFVDSEDCKDKIPDWNFDGGSTEQGSLKNSDRCLRGVRAYKDPFVEGGFLAFCEVLYHNGTHHETNTRHHLSQLVEEVGEGILVGFEQEFTFINTADLQPLGLLLSPEKQGQYYCGVGCMNAIGRFIVDEFEHACSKAGLELDGLNAEVMPGQWEFQTKAQDPLKSSDDLWVARYIMERVAEAKPVIVSYDPKPHPDFNGAACHTNISTESMRTKFEDSDISDLMAHIKMDHEEHMKVCGEGYELRMTGECEAPDHSKFTWGYSDRGASIRIPEKVKRDGAGYIEDRRPCSNIDPYKVLYSLVSSIKESNEL